eukprot:c29310_g1_i1 orf=2-163(+)
MSKTSCEFEKSRICFRNLQLHLPIMLLRTIHQYYRSHPSRLLKKLERVWEQIA